MMPTFRACRDREPRLTLALLLWPGKHATSSIFRYQSRLPLIADRDLEPLRTAETRKLPKAKWRVCRPGHGPSAGRSFRRNVRNRRKARWAFTLVAFGGAIRLRIANMF
jgi:hypothetical protein